MAELPKLVRQFLQGKRLAIAGVSRHADVAANSVFKKLRDSGYEVFPINPNAEKVEGVPCYPHVGSIPGVVDGVVIATHPDVSLSVVRQCGDLGISRVWFHRSFGTGSVSKEAVQECQRIGIDCIVGGCPLMFCEPVDFGHKCMRWWLQRLGRVPK